MRVTATDGLAFTLEIGVYAAAGAASWHLAPNAWMKPLGASAAVLMMATWWGLLHSPRASHPLGQPLDVIARTAWFMTGAAAASTLVVSR